MVPDGPWKVYESMVPYCPFVAPIFVIPLIHGILKDAQVDILLLDKAWKVGEVING